RDRRLHLRLGGVRRQLPLDRGDAHAGAVAVLAGHVRARARIVAHQDGPQSRGTPGCGQRLDPDLQFFPDRRGGRLAVQPNRRHRSILGRRHFPLAVAYVGSCSTNIHSVMTRVRLGLLSVVVLTATTAGLIACGDPPESAGPVRIGIGTPGELLPTNLNDPDSAQVVSALFAPLVDLDRQGRPYEVAAASVVPDESNRVW